MVIDVEDNPNCDGCGVMRFAAQSLPRRMTHLWLEEDGKQLHYAVTGWGPDGPAPARARRVMDSGDGTCWLVEGGDWGLRLARLSGDDPNQTVEWQLDHPQQTGQPFLTVDSEEAIGWQRAG